MLSRFVEISVDECYSAALGLARARQRLSLRTPVAPTPSSDSVQRDSLAGSSTASGTAAASTAPAGPDTSRSSAAAVTPRQSTGFTVSFAALLSEDKAQQVASSIKVNGTAAHVVSTTTAGSPIFRVVMGPFATREEANKIGRASRREFWIYEGSP